MRVKNREIEAGYGFLRIRSAGILRSVEGPERWASHSAVKGERALAFLRR